MNYIESHELDKREAPNRQTTLFYETAFKLERVFEKAGIYKIEKKKVKTKSKSSNKGLKIGLFLLCFVVAVGLSLIEK